MATVQQVNWFVLVKAWQNEGQVNAGRESPAAMACSIICSQLPEANTVEEEVRVH